MALRKGICAAFLLVLALALAHTKASSSEIQNNVGGISDICKVGVDILKMEIENITQKSRTTQIIWNFWQCLNETEIYDDANAICDLLGNILQDPKHFEMARDFFVQEQMSYACQLCDGAATALESVTEEDVTAAIQLIEPHMRDPKTAAILREHGPGLAMKIIESLFPAEVCSYLNDQCKAQTAIADNVNAIIPIPPWLQDILHNVTQCVECNVCENIVILAQVDILPSAELPVCLVELVQDNICVLLNVTGIPIIGNQGYALCVNVIKQFVGDIINALKTFLSSNLVCKSMLKACDAEHSDNVLECLCDNVKPPKLLNWLMPCRWQHDAS